MNLGAHMSIAGGFDRAIARAEAEGATALQIFTRNQKQWSAAPLSPGECAAFRAAREKSPVDGVIAHASYLINLGSPDDELWERSIAGLTTDYERSEALGVDALVFHPGAHKGAGAEAGLRRIATGVKRMLNATNGFRCRLLFETTAGSGTQLGSRFEEIARLLATSGPIERLGVCLDTCHVFAAGYDIRTPTAYRRTRREFDSIIGLAHLHALHLNDSKGKLGSRLDRHDHIGKGKIGREGFRAVMRDRKLAKVVKILETPKGDDPKRHLDRKNLALLRRLRDET